MIKQQTWYFVYMKHEARNAGLYMKPCRSIYGFKMAFSEVFLANKVFIGCENDSMYDSTILLMYK